MEKRKIIKTLFLIIVLLCPSVLFAKTKTVKCPWIANKDDGTVSKSKNRYTCFEDLKSAKKKGYIRQDLSETQINQVPSPTPTPKPLGSWEQLVSNSALLNRKIYQLRSNGKVSIYNSLGRDISYSLYIRCSEDGDFDVYIAYDDTISFDSAIYVYFSINNEMVHEELWSLSTDNQAIFSSSPVGFIGALLERERLVLRVTPIGESYYDSVFDIKNLKENLSFLAQGGCSL